MKGFLLTPKYLFLIILLITATMFFPIILTVNKIMGTDISKKINVELLYESVITEDLLLSVLETTDSHGITVKEIIAKSVFDWERLKTEPAYVNGYFVDVQEESRNILEKYIQNSYRFSIVSDSNEIILAEKGKITETSDFADVRLLAYDKEYKIVLYTDEYA